MEKEGENERETEKRGERGENSFLISQESCHLKGLSEDAYHKFQNSGKQRNSNILGGINFPKC